MTLSLPHYILFSLVVLYFVWRFYKGRKMKSELPKLLAEGAVIVDVRSPEEFFGGANPKSINIPLNLLPNRLGELDKGRPVIVCCASGGRSGMAKVILEKNGFSNVVNAGPWKNTLV